MTVFAAFLFNRPEPSTLGKLANNPREALVLIAAIFCAAFVATVWVLLLRKRRWYRRHRHHYRSSSVVSQTATVNTGRPENASSSTHTHRRRRERFTKRNPTLAETGGLPKKRAQSDALPTQLQPEIQQPQTTRNA